MLLPVGVRRISATIAVEWSGSALLAECCGSCYDITHRINQMRGLLNRALQMALATHKTIRERRKSRKRRLWNITARFRYGILHQIFRNADVRTLGTLPYLTLPIDTLPIDQSTPALGENVCSDFSPDDAATTTEWYGYQAPNWPGVPLDRLQGASSATGVGATRVLPPLSRRRRTADRARL